jgi:protein gp37
VLSGERLVAVFAGTGRDRGGGLVKKSDSERRAKGMWWDAALTANVGCTPVSPGCFRCWSAKSSKMWAENPNPRICERHEGLTVKGAYPPRFNGVTRFQGSMLLKPLHKRRSQVYSIWNDLFHDEMTDEQIAVVMATVLASRKDDFVACTKRADRLPDWFARFTPEDCRRVAMDFYKSSFLQYANPRGGWPEAWEDVGNLILMASCENQEMADKRLPFLIETPVPLKAVGLSPLLGRVDFSQYAPELSWCVAECESGMGRRPADREWFRLARDICEVQEIPFFLKQMEDCCRVQTMPRLDGVFHDAFPGVGIEMIRKVKGGRACKQ